MAVAALVLGIVSIVFCFIPGLNFIAPILGIIGIILAVVSKKQLKESNEPTGMATGGLITSIIGTVLGSILYLACAACATGTGVMMKEMDKELKKQGVDLQKEIQKGLEDARKKQQQ